MRAKLSSLSSRPIHPSNLHSKPSSSAKFKLSRKPGPCTCNNVVSQQQNATSTRFRHPEPPWLVPQPRYDDEGLAFNHQVSTASSSGTPLSLRLLQLRKKSDSLALSYSTAAGRTERLGPFGNAVWSLACLLEDFKKSAMAPAVGRKEEGEDMVRVLRDGRYSMVWLFQRVFSASPNLAVGILAMTADFMAGATEAAVLSAGAQMFMEEEREEGASEEECGGGGGSSAWEDAYKVSDYTCWSDIGILDESEKDTAVAACPGYERKMMAYEDMIARDVKEPNSMILSNYAQLLYQYKKNYDRANYYFQLAVATEPVDAEAMGRYALFLWHERGDVEMAEEMFLRATAADSGNHHHQQNYAWFLWKTGGTDTCYPLDDCVVDDDDNDDDNDDDEKEAAVLLT